jgi:hypothetical protein
LVPLLRQEPAAIPQVWQEAVADAEAEQRPVTAADVREAVERRLPPRPAALDEPPQRPMQSSPESTMPSWLADVPSVEETPEQRAYFNFCRMRLITQHTPESIAAVSHSPEADIPGFERLAEWLVRFNRALEARARRPLRAVK